MLIRTSARQYYDTNPSQRHSTGDIWSGLPTHGLLQQPLLSGIVITPACDLAQAKVETITYLPILPVVDWFSSRSFQHECTNAMRGESRLVRLDAPFLATDSPPVVPTELTAYEDALAAATLDDRRAEEALVRCQAATRLLRAILGSGRPWCRKEDWSG